jgi:NADH-quinone oxidoreductase subunit N
MLFPEGRAGVARGLILRVTGLVVLAGHGSQRREEDHGAWTASVLGIALGALVTAAASNLLALWLGIELMSLASYVVAAWRGGDRGAAEAGMKFVLFGSVATALMLFGVSHVYGLTGHLDFAGVNAALSRQMPMAAAGALCLVGVGLAYKLAIVPFHFYAPDVYQGAPALGVAAVAIVPKIGAACALWNGVAATAPPFLVAPQAVSTWLAVAAIVSMVAAALLAVVQRDAKRIVAFSAIGHAGTVVLATACVPGIGGAPIGTIAFYLAGYAAANLGALACLMVLERERGSSALAALAGSVRERPWLVAGLCLFLLSLAGLPPLAGFLGKWGVLRETIRLGLDEPGNAHLAWAALALLASTAISAWAYLLVIRATVLAPAPALPPRAAARIAPTTVAVLVACAFATVALGLWLDGFGTLARAARS